MSEVPIHLEGTDFLAQKPIRAVVRDTYGQVQPTDRRVAQRFYSDEELHGLPDETVRIALGVGNPVRHARLQLGEGVVDLGSGGGIDCLLAALAVGPEGSVVGIDFLPEMVIRAREAASSMGLANVRFLEGEIEALPRADESVDVVISNGVVNLSPRKGAGAGRGLSGAAARRAIAGRRPDPRERPADRDPDAPRGLGRLPVGCTFRDSAVQGSAPSGLPRRGHRAHWLVRH
jgi:SAM-dependent methyltransferase